MPWKLIPPRAGKTLYYYVRGKYCGIRLDHSTGASERRAAQTILGTWRKQAERGEFRLGGQEAPAASAPNFASAATAYMRAGGDGQFIEPILKVWGAKPFPEIDQIAIDTLATQLYPHGSAATRNRQVYTPVSAVLKRAGVEMKIKRPVGWKGKKSTSWLEPDQAFSLFETADKIEPEFGLFCRFLCYTGMRLSEALSRELRHLKLDRNFIYLDDSKNGEPRGCHLPAFLVQAIKEQPPRRAQAHSVRGRRWIKGEGGSSPADAGVPFLQRHPEAKLFRFHDGGRLRDMLKAAIKQAGLVFPRRQGGFHIFCHTYGSWMHRFGGLDTHGLVRTNRWADPDSADRYVHTGASEEAQRSDLLPTPKCGQVVEIKKVAG